MSSHFKIIFFILLIFLVNFFCINFSKASVEHVDGLVYVVREVDSRSLGPQVHSKYKLFELYLENRTDKAYSIPGYSIDLGLNLTSIQQINAESMSKSNTKLAALNIAAGAASLAFGGIAKTATNTAFRAVNFKNMSSGLSDDSLLLSSNKTYILYPNDALSLYFFVNRRIGEDPKIFRFICHDEDSNMNYIVINNNLTVRNENSHLAKEVNAKVVKDDYSDRNHDSDSEPLENVIAVPNSETYR